MNLQPIIRAKLNKYRDDYGLKNILESTAFERYVNHIILSGHQPDAFSGTDNLLDMVCVGGADDMGLDGICIKLNGVLISTLEEAKDVFSLHKKADIEYLFIQSKYKEKFDSGEYAKFVNGVTDFLKEDHFQPHNPFIEEWLRIKSYLMSDEVMVRWEHNPDIHMYYVVMGKWEKSPHIEAISKKFEKEMIDSNIYGDIKISYIDTAHFNRICDEIENALNVVMNIVDIFSLTEVADVENSSIILCMADEFLKLLVSEDGLMRRNLFDDNVRDYQGDTTINSEIFDTIKNNPQSFVLLNNGITIVCDDIVPGNRKVTIKNPQIVNGCQTCNVLYGASRKNINLTDVSITVKIIATHSDSITNSIVKGTNRQNIVYDEAFEITRPFHKELEALFAALSNENGMKIFYERRSKQFANNPSIKPLQKVNLRIILQSFVGIFLNEPHYGHRHELKLLQDYKNKIFVDSQSKYPYYVAPVLYMSIERKCKEGGIAKELKTYKMQLAWILKELIAGDTPSINNEKQIDEYCDVILRALLDPEKKERMISKAEKVFLEIRDAWIEEKGESHRFGIKDSQEFTAFAKSRLAELAESRKTDAGSGNPQLQCRGKVIKLAVDRHGYYYGFITRKTDNIFFHSKDNPQLDFTNLYGRDVLYTATSDRRKNEEKAIAVTVIE